MSEQPTSEARLSQVSAADRSGRAWMRHVAASGPQGKRWCETYERSDGVETVSTEALSLLRQRSFREGRARLEVAATARDRLPASLERSIVSVLDRWYYGTLGYADYLAGNLDRAADSMEKAREAVVTALSDAPFLLPFANHCQEFTMHRARIERNRRRWPAMWEHIEEARAMILERRPFCRLRDGSPVDMPKIQRFYEGLKLSDEERSGLGVLTSLERRERLFGAFLRRLLTPPDFTIAGP